MKFDKQKLNYFEVGNKQPVILNEAEVDLFLKHANTLLQNASEEVKENQKLAIELINKKTINSSLINELSIKEKILKIEQQMQRLNELENAMTNCDRSKGLSDTYNLLINAKMETLKKLILNAHYSQMVDEKSNEEFLKKMVVK